MAEGTLLLVIGKIAGALADEVVKSTVASVADNIKLLSQVRSRMFQIKAEFEVIQAFLNHTEVWLGNHLLLEIWVKQVRELAFDVEDTMDEYTHLLGRVDNDEIRWPQLYKGKSLQRLKNFRNWLGVANHLGEILNRLQHLGDMKARYGIATSMSDDRDSSRHGSSSERYMAEHASFIDDNDVVGFEVMMDSLKQWLTSEGDSPKFAIISVWGMAGLGKSTLVTKVYYDIMGNFDCHAWVTVSQTYRVEDLLRKIKKELLKGKEGLAQEGADDISMDASNLADTIKGILTGQRYLIILDDVWNPSVLSELRGALDLREEGNGSGRIILTTRDRNVASCATRGHMMELQPLSEDSALKLLMVKAFPKGGEYPEYLHDVATKIVQKSGRLPLAIVSLGSLLSLKKKKMAEWEKVHEGLDWELNNNPELDHLRSALLLSYRYLPNYLKHCFLYCSIFPQGYYIKRKRLIRLWIAEGFIQRRGKRTLEDVAEDILTELVRRCMLQTKKNDSGRVKFCQMHDMMRELALSLSEREGLCHVYEHSHTRLEGKVRRLSVHSCEDHQIRNVNMFHIRSLVLFNRAEVNFNSSRLLRVLDLEGCRRLERLPDAVWDLFNLHYLSLRKTHVNKIPSSLKRLGYLQTLDLAFTKVRKLPSSLSKLTHLRNLFVHAVNDSKSETYNYFSGFPAPKGIWNLENLHTLQGVEANGKFIAHLENMVQLRTFRIIKVRATHHAMLCVALQKMQNLQRLDVMAASEEEEDQLSLGDLSTPPPRLQKLTLRGGLKGGVLPCWFSSLTNLTWLRLGWSTLSQSQDPLCTLQALPNLVFLLLLKAYNGTDLNILEGFAKLRDLRLLDMKELQHIQIGEGAMPNLRQLHLVRCPNLQKLPAGLRGLKKCEAVFLEDMPDALDFGELDDDRRIRRITGMKIRATYKLFGERDPSNSNRGQSKLQRTDTS